MSGRDWERAKREAHDMRGEAPQHLPPIVRRLVYREQFGHGSELTLYEDNERDTYEAVLTREGLRTRSCRLPKSMRHDGAAKIIKAIMALT